MKSQTLVTGAVRARFSCCAVLIGTLLPFIGVFCSKGFSPFSVSIQIPFLDVYRPVWVRFELDFNWEFWILAGGDDYAFPIPCFLFLPTPLPFFWDGNVESFGNFEAQNEIQFICEVLFDLEPVLLRVGNVQPHGVFRCLAVVKLVSGAYHVRPRGVLW